jgi:hypothetical protein
MKASSPTDKKQPPKLLRRKKKAGGVGDPTTEPGKARKKLVASLDGDLPPPRTHRFPLERGWTKRRLIHDLARMEKTNTQLAQHYGVAQSAISQFKKRHAAEIEEVKADMENEFAGLWIARKVNRIAEYQDTVESLVLMSEEGTLDTDAARVKIQVLKAVAEEMGHLPAKTQVIVDQRRARYEIKGVDLEKL